MNTKSSADLATSPSGGKRWRVLAAGTLAHLTHDGFTDMLYVFFPIWQLSFQLSFMEVGLLRTLFSGAMAAFQLPSGLVVAGIGSLAALVLGTTVTSLSLASLGFASSPALLFALLVIGGIGSSAQHPVASSAIANSYEATASRVAIGTYNFSGDIGKLIFPSTAAVLIAHFGWETTISAMGLCGLISAAIVMALLSGVTLDRCETRALSPAGRFSFLRGRDSLPFISLSCIGIVDSATRTALLTFLPFLLRAKGADMPTVGLALSLIFTGGAVGKFVCGAAAGYLGILRTVVITELATALFICSIINLQVNWTLLLCPLLGAMLNGTSSVLYGSVPELVPLKSRNDAFACFYTCTIGAGALSPFLYGIAGDAFGVKTTLVIVAAMAAASIPLTIPLRGKLGWSK
ncbi:MAG: MFS transporter [Syntrophobacteraceae bacterium]